MKMRIGFVSNSSSSSFFVDLGRYPEVQREFIISKLLEWKDSEANTDGYSVGISEDRLTVSGWTSMNNDCSIHDILEELKISHHTNFEDYC